MKPVHSALIAVTMACTATAVHATNPYLACGFDSEIPSSFLMYDNDGLEPSPDVRVFGFEKGTPWVWVSDNGNGVACSTSWYAQEGTSDDWLISEPFRVEDATALLRWSARATDARFSDGYEVYVCDGAETPDDFRRHTPLFSIVAENAEWTPRSLSLADFAGQTVRVAFVNNSHNCSRLLLDDIFCGVPTRLTFVNTTPEVITHEGSADVTLKVLAGENPFSGSFSVTVSSAAGERTWQLEGDITHNEPMNVTLPGALTLSGREPQSFTVSLRQGDEEYVTSHVTRSYPRRTLLEEFTGTWCGYCVKGVVYTEQMREEFGDIFIPVAVHEGEDVMALEDYPSVFVPESYPVCLTDRSKSTQADPSVMRRYFLLSQSEPFVGAIDIDTRLENKSIRATATVRFARDMRDAQYSIGYVLTESGISHPGDPYYYQHNSYAGTDTQMGGYENMPEWIDGFTYNDVARCSWGGLYGIEGSLPATADRYEAVTYESVLDLPDNVEEASRCHLIALLIDNTTGKVVNAAAAPLGTSGVQSLTIDSSVASLNAWFDLTGRMINVPDAPGIYIRVMDGKATKVMF